MSLWADGGSARAFGAPRKGGGHLDAVERVKDWTRERFGLAPDAPVVLTEGTTSLPGFPPHETLVVFWIEGTRHHFKVFKPVEDVAADDIPPAFMKQSLAEGEGISCACC